MVKTNWRKGRKLGAGSYGTVFLGETDHPNFPIVAIKSATYPKAEWLQKEELTLQELGGCDHIVRCLGSSTSIEKNSNNYEVCYNMFLEYALGGTLEDLIKNGKGGKLSEQEVVKYTRMILLGLRHVHEKGYVHCDLKPSNILVFDGNILKIADFGLSKKVGEHEHNGSIFRGTPIYMSPESVTAGEHEPPLDIWSLGCIVVQMVTGKPLWSCHDTWSLYSSIALSEDMPELPPELSETGKDFLRLCFDRDCKGRWTAEMLLRYHPFLNEDVCPLSRCGFSSCMCAFCMKVEGALEVASDQPCNEIPQHILDYIVELITI